MAYDGLGKRLWQQTLIRLACSRLLKRLMEGNPLTAALSRRFVGGADHDRAAAKARALEARGIRTSIYYLGEYVRDAETVDENVRQIVQIAETYDREGLDLFLSVDPSQIGYALADELGLRNALRIAERVLTLPRTRVFMLDMEDHGYVDKTLALHSALRARGVPVGITLQAYLRRTEADCAVLCAQGATVRLVKGASVERPEIAWTTRQDVDASFIRLSRLLLSAESKARGVYPIFATHDETMIETVTPLLAANGWQRGEYEFEMLLGVREALQRRVVADGHPLRLYVPFGKDWWPYTARRVGERPANLRFLLQALVAR